VAILLFLLLLFCLLFLLAPLILATVMEASAPVIILLCVFIFPIIIVFSIFVSLLKMFAYGGITVEGQGVFESLESAFQLIFRRLGSVVLAILVTIGIGLVYGLVSVILSLAVHVPAAMIGAAGNQTLSILLQFAVGTPISFIISLVGLLYFFPFWVLVYLRLSRGESEERQPAVQPEPVVPPAPSTDNPEPATEPLQTPPAEVPLSTEPVEPPLRPVMPEEPPAPPEPPEERPKPPTPEPPTP
jgi:hypothetical protein